LTVRSGKVQNKLGRIGKTEGGVKREKNVGITYFDKKKVRLEEEKRGTLLQIERGPGGESLEGRRGEFLHLYIQERLTEDCRSDRERGIM